MSSDSRVLLSPPNGRRLNSSAQSNMRRRECRHMGKYVRRHGLCQPPSPLPMRAMENGTPCSTHHCVSSRAPTLRYMARNHISYVSTARRVERPLQEQSRGPFTYLPVESSDGPHGANMVGPASSISRHRCTLDRAMGQGFSNTLYFCRKVVRKAVPGFALAVYELLE